jgi:hypothetical protein
MTVSYHQWGLLLGGIDPATGLPVIPASGGGGGGGGVSGPPEMFSGTLGGGVTTITFSAETVGISIRNTDDGNALEYSFDNATWFSCIAYQVIQEGVQIEHLYLRAVAGAPTYQVLGLLSA